MSEIVSINYAIAQIHERLGFLFHDGFQIAKIFRNLSFGNWIIVLRSKKCMIRLIQDRGQLSMEVAPPWTSLDIKNDEHFTDLNLFINFMENKEIIVSPHREVKSITAQFDELSMMLQSYYSQIISTLNNDNYSQIEEEISLYHQRYVKKLFPNARFRPR